MRTRLSVAVLSGVIILTACEGRRSLDNPENLDNMPPALERSEDTADLHNAQEADDRPSSPAASMLTTQPVVTPATTPTP